MVKKLTILSARSTERGDSNGRKVIELRRMVSSGMLRRVDLVRTDVSEEPGASFITVTRIGELGTIQAATSNRRTLRRNKSHMPYQPRRHHSS
jgi:hypothetical protein